MTGFEKFVYKHISLLRRIIQISTVIFIFIVPLLNKAGINHITGTFYSISVGNLDIVDPALMLQTILLTKQIFFPLLLAGLIPLIITLLLGKVFCSWVCPFNLLAEFADRLRRIIRPGSVKVHNNNPKPHYYWLVFGSIIMLVAILGVPIISFISMPGLITGQVADLIFAGVVGFEILLVIVILLLEIFIATRFWCKYACPVGATLALFRFKNTLKIKFTASKCVCSTNTILKCNAACPLQLDPRNPGIYPYCYNCGECVDACRHNGQALLFSFQSEDKKIERQPMPKIRKKRIPKT